MYALYLDIFLGFHIELPYKNNRYFAILFLILNNSIYLPFYHASFRKMGR